MEIKFGFKHMKFEISIEHLNGNVNYVIGNTNLKFKGDIVAGVINLGVVSIDIIIKDLGVCAPMGVPRLTFKEKKDEHVILTFLSLRGKFSRHSNQLFCHAQH